MSCYVIAEAGVNHNGDLPLALEMIDAAADAGADAVKFQTFVPENLCTANAAKATYQAHNQPDGDNQLQMLEKLALSFDAHHALLAHCEQRNIEFLSSPFDIESADFLIEELKLPRLKLGSGELTNGPLLWRLARSGRPLILSTGMARLREIHQALGLICHALNCETAQPQRVEHFEDAFTPEQLIDHVSLLHCTTDYPCPKQDVNLKAMDTLARTFGLACGYSDHTEGTTISLAAAARGAQIIEKHFTLGRAMPGPDHRASIEPEELSAMVQGIRDIEQALGSSEKKPTATELEHAEVARKSLCAASVIAKDAIFSADNLTSKRPGNGITPMQYWKLLGTPSHQAYQPDQPIEWPPLAQNQEPDPKGNE